MLYNENYYHFRLTLMIDEFERHLREVWYDMNPKLKRGVYHRQEGS